MKKSGLKFDLTVATKTPMKNTKPTRNYANVTKITGTVVSIDKGITKLTVAGVEYTGDSYFSADNTKSFYYKDVDSPTGITHRLLTNKAPNSSVACYRCKPGDSVTGYIKNNIFHGIKVN